MVLDFNGENGKRLFEFCFVGFILGGCLQQHKGLSVLRREMSLFEKLESISELKPCGKKMVNDEPERQLLKQDKKNPISLQIRIDPPEFDLLYNYVSQVPWQSGTPVRHALETIEWLERANRSAVPV